MPEKIGEASLVPPMIFQPVATAPAKDQYTQAPARTLSHTQALKTGERRRAPFAALVGVRPNEPALPDRGQPNWMVRIPRPSWRPSRVFDIARAPGGCGDHQAVAQKVMGPSILASEFGRPPH